MEKPIIRVNTEGVATPETMEEEASVKKLREEILETAAEFKNPTTRERLYQMTLRFAAMQKELEELTGPIRK